MDIKYIFYLALLSLNHSLESGAEDDVLSVAGDGAFVLSPEERPVVEVLEVVRLAEQQSWCHITRDEREVGAVVAIEHLFRACCSDDGYKRVVVVGMAAIECK